MTRDPKQKRYVARIGSLHLGVYWIPLPRRSPSAVCSDDRLCGATPLWLLVFCGAGQSVRLDIFSSFLRTQGPPLVCPQVRFTRTEKGKTRRLPHYWQALLPHCSDTYL